MSKATTLLAALALCVSLATANAQPIISVPSITVERGSIVQVPIYISGGTPIIGVDLGAQIGDGGWAMGGSQDFPQAPQFLNTDLTNGIFRDNNWGPSGNQLTGFYPAGATWESIYTVNGAVIGQGLLGTFTIQAGYQDGVWPLILGLPDWGIFTTVYDASGNPIEVALANSSITVMPEPAAAALLGVGAMALLRIRRRAH